MDTDYEGNAEHLAILRHGVEGWNRWRQEHLALQPDLHGAQLRGEFLGGAHLSLADLGDADLSGADLRGAFLIGARLSGAHLDGAHLSGAHLSGAHLSGAEFGGAHLCVADLSWADFPRAILRGAVLIEADLSGAEFSGADLGWADLRGADLSDANLTQANLRGANLGGANLRGAYLSGAELHRTGLRGTDLSQALLGNTILADVDLSAARGLEAVQHYAPSTLGSDTLYRSQGRIPEGFLRGCGVPEEMIAFAREMTQRPIEFNSCFISCAPQDRAFVERLSVELQTQGVRCWHAPADLQSGERLRAGIAEAIRAHDKLLLVLSSASLASPWVEQEVETALARERHEGQTVLVPARIDEAVLGAQRGWARHLRNSRPITDLSGWQEQASGSAAYQEALRLVLHDLKAG